MEVWEKWCIGLVQTELSKSLHMYVMPDHPGMKGALSQHADPGLVIVESCPIRVYQRLAETLMRVLRNLITSQGTRNAHVPTLFDANVSQFARPRNWRPDIGARGSESIALAKGYLA
jgi:hypothetical protein